MFLREVFPILEDSVSGFGVAPTRVIDGTNPDTGGPSGGFVNGLMVLAFKDSNGNLVLPQLDALGRLPVTDDVVGQALYSQGSIAAGVTSGMTIVPGTTIVLVGGKRYADIDLVLSCSRTAEGQLIWNNNGSENILVDCLVGAGEYSFSPNIANLTIVAGVSGVQQLYVKAQNLDKASQISATVVALQLN